MRTLSILATAISLAFGAASCGAQAPNLQKGDVVHLDAKIEFDAKDKPGDTVSKKVCLPPGSGLDVFSVQGDQLIFTRRTRLTQDNSGTKDCDDRDLPSPSADDRLFYATASSLKPDYYRLFGIAHGALFVPFKRRSDKSLSGESNLGYYVGYRFPAPLGVTITPALSAGLSLVNVTDDSATSGTTSRSDTGVRAAFTVTGGVILKHLDAFQVGLFVGKDRIGGDVGASWKYEGKRWTSIAIGYQFSR